MADRTEEARGLAKAYQPGQFEAAYRTLSESGADGHPARPGIPQISRPTLRGKAWGQLE